MGTIPSKEVPAWSSRRGTRFPCVLRVLLDARVTTGGTRRYYEVLSSALTTGALAHVATANPRGWLAPPFTPWGRRAVAALARETGADLIHGCHIEIPRTDRPTVATIHDLIPLDHRASMPSPLKRRIYAAMVKRTLDRAGHIIAVSTQTADSLLRHGADARRLTVVANGVSKIFRPLNEKEAIEARARFASGGRYVATIGSQKWHKNRSVLGELQLAGGVTLRSPTDVALSDAELRLFYGGADVFILPSLIEGFGYPVAEALACGTPVVCGAGVGALEHLRPGCMVVDVSRADSIASALGRLISDPAMRSELAEAGRAAAVSLSPERMAHETLAVYEAVLSDR